MAPGSVFLACTRPESALAHPAELLDLRWTKLSPPRTAGDLVPRARVRDRLDHSLKYPLTLVCAPAGYGKTTLLSDWLAGSGYPYAWLSLDESDNDLAVFLNYIVAAIRTAYPQVCTNTLGLLAAPELPSPTLLANALANDLEALPCQPGPADGRCCILVLDDYHLVHNEAIHTLLGEIWRHPPRTVHLILCTRQDSPLPLDVLRARGELCEIRVQDLRFTRAEVAVFMQQATELSLDEPAITLLAERTEGWAAGLRLAALALTTHDDIYGHLAELPTNNRYVMDYLMGEVLSHVPAATLEFLLKTSILDRLNGPLCDAVAGTVEAQWRGQDYLAWLAHAGLFTWSTDPQQQWYRCHQLFRKLLRNQLEQRYRPEEITQLHIRASAWLAGNGFIDEAIEHSLTAGDVAEAVRLVEAHRHAAMNQERWHDLQRWLGRLPRQSIDAHPELVLAEAWLLHHRAVLAGLPERLARAEALLQHERVPPEPLGEHARLSEETRLSLQGEVDALTSQLVYWTADAGRTLALTQRALAVTPIEHLYVRALARLFAATALQMRGDIRGAIETLDEGLREDRLDSYAYAPRLLASMCFVYWVAADLPHLLQTADHLLELARERDLAESLDWAHYFRGCAHYQWNDLEAAARDFAAVVPGHTATHGIVFPHSTFGLASTHQAQGRVEPARGTAATVVKYALEMNNPSMLADARAFEAHLALLQGRAGEAARWVAQADRNIRTTPMPLFYAPNFTLVEILLAQGTPASLGEAARLLARLHEVVQTLHNTRFLIEALALQALLHDARHERGAALDALEQAIALAEPDGVIRVFVDLGPRMAALLHQLAAQGVGPAGFIATLLAAFPAARAPTPTSYQSSLIELLSERELEVLALLAQRLTNKEIALALSISPMTVKRHSSNIYQKLAVESRREAVAKAAALGIVSAVPYPHLPLPPQQ
jgi:LuxR family transcriptional regulator, maltose regulon positive regulatory protein